MKKITTIIISIIAFITLSQAVIISSVSASCVGDGDCININSLPHSVVADHSTIAIVLNIVFTIVGLISVLMIVLAGFKYIMSSGKPEELAKAKDSIIYAAVGIVVCILAVTIVSFVAGFIG